ncbi:uncharacterized protein LOC134215009 isoform X5 [Armigeres subalbatus]|uniref:uncharacterized protein LOC134215009 isoform X5 n=1 Tax=Armigeres subalbatus TaxID=124917 RepID=UPI002ED10280
MSVRRFVSRRGAPIEIHSDNGTNFRGADRLLKEQIQNISEAMAETFTNATTKWVFIPPSAPHMGGSWERMVRSVKSAMEAANGGRRLDDEGLLTLAQEAESMAVQAVYDNQRRAQRMKLPLYGVPGDRYSFKWTFSGDDGHTSLKVSYIGCGAG